MHLYIVVYQNLYWIVIHNKLTGTNFCDDVKTLYF